MVKIVVPLANEDAIIKSIEAKGQLAVTAQTGGSALKAYQNICISTANSAKIIIAQAPQM